MVDIPPPPPPPPPVPPEEPGPDVNSDEWHVVNATKNKRRDFGAGIGFTTSEKIRHFHLEVTVNAEYGQDDEVPNLYELHPAFVEKLMSVTEGDTHLTPTAKDNKNSKESKTTKSPILSVDGFPTTDVLHRKFFHRFVKFNPQKQSTLIKIYHEVLMKETVAQAKAKLLEWLQSKKLWIKASELNAVETSGIGWLLSAHPTLVFKPHLS